MNIKISKLYLIWDNKTNVDFHIFKDTFICYLKKFGISHFWKLIMCSCIIIFHQNFKF